MILIVDGAALTAESQREFAQLILGELAARERSIRWLALRARIEYSRLHRALHMRRTMPLAEADTLCQALGIERPEVSVARDEESHG